MKIRNRHGQLRNQATNIDSDISSWDFIAPIRWKDLSTYLHYKMCLGGKKNRHVAMLYTKMIDSNNDIV